MAHFFGPEEENLTREKLAKPELVAGIIKLLKSEVGENRKAIIARINELSGFNWLSLREDFDLGSALEELHESVLWGIWERLKRKD
jgi:hypothetical protein